MVQKCGRRSFVRFVYADSQNSSINSPEISTFIRTDEHGQIDSAIDPDQEYI